MPTFREMLAAAKAAVREIEPAEAEQEIAAGNAVVLDVREPDEYEQGALPDAVHIPRGTLETSVEGRIPDKSESRGRLLRRRHPLRVRSPDHAGVGGTPTWPQ